MTGAARHAPRPHARIPASTGIPDRSLRSAYNNALDEVALYNISDGAADTFRTTGDLLLPWMRKSDFRGALCPEQNSARCEASTFDAVGTLFRLMIPVAAAVREMARAAGYTLGCAHAACCAGEGVVPPPLPPAPPSPPAPPPDPPAPPTTPAPLSPHSPLPPMHPECCACSADGGGADASSVDAVAADRPPPPSSPPPTTPGGCAVGVAGFSCQMCSSDGGCAELPDAGGGTCDAGRGLAWRAGEVQKGLDCRDTGGIADAAVSCIIDGASAAAGADAWAGGVARGSCTLWAEVAGAVDVECSLVGCEFLAGVAGLSCESVSCESADADEATAAFVASINGAAQVDCTGGERRRRQHDALLRRRWLARGADRR